MTPMSHYILLSVAGLSVSGLLVLRHACRRAPLLPPAHDYDLPSPAQRTLSPADCQRGRVGIKARADRQLLPVATGRLMKKLRREELRQRPQEGRN